MVTDLIPEWLGLIATPLAVIGSTVLLGTARPIANAASFAAGFGIVYAVLAVIVLAIGDAADVGDSGTARDVVSLVIGLLFLAAAVALLIRPKVVRTGPPAWAQTLQKATPRRSFVTACALSLVNPNIAILLSGLTIVVTSDASLEVQIFGAGSLALASQVPLVVPIGVFLTMGAERGHAVLNKATQWMTSHDKALSAGTLLVFGAAFAIRGLIGIL